MPLIRLITAILLLLAYPIILIWLLFRFELPAMIYNKLRHRNPNGYVRVVKYPNDIN